MIIKTKTYVVGGYKNGKFETVGIDQNSGGYPYAAGFNGRRVYKVLDTSALLADAKSTYVGIVQPKVYEIVFEEISAENIIKTEKKLEDILSSLTDEEKDHLKKKL